MPQSLAEILVHLVFSTKNREALLADSNRADLHAYIGGVVNHHGGIDGMSPLQGWVLLDSETQGGALGYRMTPLRGFGFVREVTSELSNPI